MIFVPLEYQIEQKISAMINCISLKSQDIHSKLVLFDSIRLTLQVSYKTMLLSLKNNHLFSKKLRFSFLSPNKSKTQFWIWSMIAFWKLKVFVQI